MMEISHKVNLKILKKYKINLKELHCKACYRKIFSRNLMLLRLIYLLKKILYKNQQLVRIFKKIFSNKNGLKMI